MSADVPNNFWEIITKADRDRQKLREILKKMSRTEIAEFYVLFDRLAMELRSPPYAAEDASEDDAEDLAKWAVAQGKDYYFDVLRNPPKMPHTLPNKRGIGFVSTIYDVFYELFGEELSEIHITEPWSE